jgi:hypothetical protein
MFKLIPFQEPTSMHVVHHPKHTRTLELLVIDQWMKLDHQEHGMMTDPICKPDQATIQDIKEDGKCVKSLTNVLVN